MLTETAEKVAQFLEEEEKSHTEAVFNYIMKLGPHCFNEYSFASPPNHVMNQKTTFF